MAALWAMLILMVLVFGAAVAMQVQGGWLVPIAIVAAVMLLAMIPLHLRRGGPERHV